MDESAYDIWNRISRTQISDDGKWVSYEVGPEDADGQLKLYSVDSHKAYTFDRGTRAFFASNSNYLIFTIKPHKDSIKMMKRKKVKKKDLPKDTLAIYSIEERFINKIPNIKSFQVGEEWDSHLVYHLAPKNAEKQPDIEITEEPQDSTAKKKKPKLKKETDKNGSKLIVRSLISGKEDTLGFVKKYKLAKKAMGIAAVSTGTKKHQDHVSLYNVRQGKFQKLQQQRGKYSNLAFSEDGTQLSFVADLDTTENLVRPYELFFWNTSNRSARKIADHKSAFLPKDWNVSNDSSPFFTEDGSKMIFQIKPPEIMQDTSLLDNEIVNVEVWNYKDGRLHTQQKVRLGDEKKRGYDVVYHLKQNKFLQLEDENVQTVNWNSVEQGKTLIGVDNSKYLQNITHLGYTNYDVYKVDPKDGKKKMIAQAIDAYPRISPHGRYVYWFSRKDTSWMAYDLKKNKLRTLTDNSVGSFYDLRNDRPMLPRSNGSLGWTEDDKIFYVYDNYDIWTVDPSKDKSLSRLTKGAEQKKRFRYIRLDSDEKFIDPEKNALLHFFSEEDKTSGYSYIDLKSKIQRPALSGAYRFNTRLLKAKNSEAIVFTKQNFQTFPDLLVTTDQFKTAQTISDANPQQKDYRWGNIEIVKWTSLDNIELEGLLIKPDDFDPTKKYPLLVNFYERSADGIHRHRTPAAGRSSINYSFYVSKGYVIFNPDIIYKNGYPGESCYNSVIPGVEKILEAGYIDKDRIGVQGHSWGGYQIAHLLTKTDIFKCAEAGAPVVNMVSAYGGIRWGSGMSRMFQYEKTQSRLGATLWERPDLYLENSPIFNIDKVNTPVLILHNDEDGAVPWYQGIEYFVALRRLGKPSWLLNYNGEPHWPVKRQNRVDFQTRMAQFFDHYLMDAPMPVWMDKGVDAMNKGINQGLELIEEGDEQDGK